MALKFRAPRGTSDLIYPESEQVRNLLEVAGGILHLHGYRSISTPVIESTALFQRSIGEHTDIVTKEMYTFEDRGGESLTLRPEGTAPVVRAFLENSLASGGLPCKLYYQGPMFRRERPQAGRFRQFHQLGAEAIGSADPFLDAELMALNHRLFERLGLLAYRLAVNSVGCSSCREPYLRRLVSFLEQQQHRLCEQCSRRAGENPLRVFDCKNEQCRESLESAPLVIDGLCAPCRDHFDRVRSSLDFLEVPFRVDGRLVRGLDYYTRTAFEFQFEGLGSQNTVSAGGRYDCLVEQLGGPPTPAVGFSLGLERLLMALGPEGLEPFNGQRLSLFVAGLKDADRTQLLLLLTGIRRAGISAEADFMERGLKAQMKQAARLGARFAVIAGGEEQERGEVVLRDMDAGEQRAVPREEVIARLGELLH